MPTLSAINLPKPKDWNEFEEITLDAVKLKWSTPNWTRHGRQGQKQFGVDIYGYDERRFLIGIQCKNTVNNISELKIDSEIQKAERFQPPLHSLYIATTADSCVKIQQYVRELFLKRQKDNKFSIGILFWNDICQELAKNPTILDTMPFP